MREYILIPGELPEEVIKYVLSNDDVSLGLSPSCKQAIIESQQTVEEILSTEKIVYGINTGFGQLANKVISKNNLVTLQKNLVLSHACGTGDFLPEKIVRLILLLKINNLAQGYSGVRLSLIETLIALFNQRVYPKIYARGSVGASGDLVPLAHMVVPLLGEGEFSHHDKTLSSLEGLKLIGLDKPLELAPKEGLALLNGMQVSNAIALDALFAIERLFDNAMISGAMSVDAIKGSDSPFDSRVHIVRGHKTQVEVAEILRGMLKGSEIRASHNDCNRVQDPYSIRCQPQVMGACLNQINQAKRVLLQEANAVSDNPLVFSKEKEIISGGNFHGEIVAMAADNLALAIAEIGALSERRIALLIDSHLSGLPPFLIEESGVNSGFMIAHVSAASAASDNKARAHPHSVDSLPTSANQEDHVSMATNAALRLFPMIENVETILAIEFLAAAQGIEFHRPLKSSAIIEKVITQIRDIVPFMKQDRYFAPDIAKMKQVMKKTNFRINEK